jgi:hypothetical protein
MAGALKFFGVSFNMKVPSKDNTVARGARSSVNGFCDPQQLSDQSAATVSLLTAS